MTAQEMQYDFELKIGSFHDLDKKEFTSVDISHFLTQAQHNFIWGRYDKNFNPVGNYFEMDERTRVELDPLLKNFNATGAALVSNDDALHPDAVFVAMPSDFEFSVKEMCVTVCVDCNNSNATALAKVLPIRYQEYIDNVRNPFRKPNKYMIWRMDYGVTGASKHELVYGDSVTLQSYTMRYIRKPTAIDINNEVDCQLPEFTHGEIVDEAIQIAYRLRSKEVVSTQPKNKDNGQ